MLYTSEMVSRLQKLRSRLYAEFGIRIRLADPELLDILSALAPRTRDPISKNTIGELLSLAGRESAEKKSLEAITEITYRGHKIPSTDEQQNPAPGAKKHVYRGRVFYK